MSKIEYGPKAKRAVPPQPTGPQNMNHFFRHGKEGKNHKLSPFPTLVRGRRKLGNATRHEESLTIRERFPNLQGGKKRGDQVDIFHVPGSPTGGRCYPRIHFLPI